MFAQDKIGRGPDFTIQPWQFGHGESKAICFWTKGLPPLRPTNVVAGREGRIHKMKKDKNRSKNRSIFYTGIAKAMAQQWDDTRASCMIALREGMIYDI